MCFSISATFILALVHTLFRDGEAIIQHVLFRPFADYIANNLQPLDKPMPSFQFIVFALPPSERSENRQLLVSPIIIGKERLGVLFQIPGNSLADCEIHAKN